MKWLVEYDKHGNEHRFPYNENLAKNPRFKVIDDAETAAPVVVQQEHPDTVRESAPGNDEVAIQDHATIKLKRPPNSKVKA